MHRTRPTVRCVGNNLEKKPEDLQFVTYLCTVYLMMLPVGQTIRFLTNEYYIFKSICLVVTLEANVIVVS